MMREISSEDSETGDPTGTLPVAMPVARVEAQAWLRRLHSGEATTEDLAGLKRWKAASADHASAFAEASLLWTVLHDAAHQAERGRDADADIARPNFSASRRGFLVGGAALAASAAGAMVVRPPLDLWPSASELAADYRTSAGERRQLDIGQQLAIELNTRTSVDVRPVVDGTVQFELVSGEAAVASRPGQAGNVTVVAGSGRSSARNASFNIRKIGADVRVSCIDGALDVISHDRPFALAAGQQLAYNADGPGEIVAADPEIVTAWQRGMLVFRRAPLAEVIEEVNRYRAGRVVLWDAALAQRQVMANFRLDRIDDVITFISKAMNVRVRSLPGGVVLVG